MEKVIRLSSEQFQGLLQGKKLQFEEMDGKRKVKKTTIYPPHYGLYFTYEQVAEIKHLAASNAIREMFELIDSLKQ